MNDTASQNSISVVVNGENISLAQPLTVLELLAHLNLASRGIAVELNRELIPGDRHHLIVVQDKDVVEIVTLVGGG